MTRKTTRKETAKTSRDQINDRLHDAIEGLRKDVTRVEVWATALGSFSQPVPDYSPSKTFELGQDSGQDSGPAQAPADGANQPAKIDVKRG